METTTTRLQPISGAVRRCREQFRYAVNAANRPRLTAWSLGRFDAMITGSSMFAVGKGEFVAERRWTLARHNVPGNKIP